MMSMYKITYDNVISIARTEEELFDKLVRRLCFLHVNVNIKMSI